MIGDIKKQILDNIQSHKRIAICGHRNPDFDCISSALVLYFFIKEKFSLNPVVFIEDKIGGLEFYDTLTGFESIKFVDDITQKLNDFDLVIFVDSNSYKRFTSNVSGLAQIVKEKDNILIDHHGGGTDFFKIRYVETNSPSCAGMFLDFLFNEDEANYEMAFWSVVGILSDTSRLSFIDKTQIFEVNKLNKLVSKFQIDLSYINKVLGYKVKYDVEIERELFRNMRILHTDKLGTFVCSYVGDKFYENDFGRKSLAESMFINQFLYNIDDAKWGFVVKKKEDGVFKISFRSDRGGKNVRLWAEKLGGGGHDYAAGLTLKFKNTVKASFVLDYIIEKLGEL
jgi:phosphoesterase RecJ-like protein